MVIKQKNKETNTDGENAGIFIAQVTPERLLKGAVTTGGLGFLLKEQDVNILQALQNLNKAERIRFLEKEAQLTK